MNVIIHIGYPKTASSWFQQNLFPFVENYKIVEKKVINEKIIFPHQNLFSAEYSKNYLFEKYGSNIILSHESLIGHYNTGAFNGMMTKTMAERLKATFDNPTIVLFLRNQVDLITSLYLQYIKAGGTQRIRKYLHPYKSKNFNNLSSFSFEYFHYNKIIEFYINFFGKESVKVFLYEEFKENPIKFIDCFIKELNFEIDLKSINYNIINVRLRLGLFLIFKFLNYFQKGNVLNKQYFINIPYLYFISRKLLKKFNRYKVFGPFTNPDDLLKNRSKSVIIKLFRESNNILIQKYKLDKIKKYNYPL